MVSTAHANLSVGPPYDLGLYRNGSLTMEQYRLESGSPYLQELQDTWIAEMVVAIDKLPPMTEKTFSR